MTDFLTKRIKQLELELDLSEKQNMKLGYCVSIYDSLYKNAVLDLKQINKEFKEMIEKLKVEPLELEGKTQEEVIGLTLNSIVKNNEILFSKINELISAIEKMKKEAKKDFQ